VSAPKSLLSLSDRLEALSKESDPREVLHRTVDWVIPGLAAALAYGDGSKGGRPPYDPVAMLKLLVLAAQNNVANARMEYLIRDRLSWPPAKTLADFESFVIH